MLENIVSDIVCMEFKGSVGKHQAAMECPKAMLATFGSKVDHDKEDGYRYLELLVYAPMNYVQVWMRERWNVISLDDMEFDEDSMECYPKDGAEYAEGASEWRLLADHDSEWPEGVRRFFREKGSDLLTLSTAGSGSWCQVVEVGKLDLPDDKASARGILLAGAARSLGADG